jgi:hypothetical protein
MYIGQMKAIFCTCTTIPSNIFFIFFADVSASASDPDILHYLIISIGPVHFPAVGIANSINQWNV